MAARRSPKRHMLDVIARPEGGSGGTGALVVPPVVSANPQRTGPRASDPAHADIEKLRSRASQDVRMLPLLLDAAEVAHVLGIGRTKAFQLIARGEIPVIRIGRCVRVPTDTLREWVAARTQPTSTIDTPAR